MLEHRFFRPLAVLTPYHRSFQCSRWLLVLLKVILDKAQNDARLADSGFT